MTSTRLPGLVAFVLLALVLVGCGSPSPAANVSVTTPAAPTPAIPTPSTNQVVIWGEVPAPPSCSCDHPDYLGRVDRGLAEVHLDQGFTQQKVSGQWQLFTVAFDPRTVSTQQVVKIIKERGGTIVSVSGGPSAN